MSSVKVVALAVAILFVAEASAIAAPSCPKTAKATVETALKAVKDHDAKGLYGLAPATYQKDIQALVSRFTSQLDKDLFAKGVEVLELAMKVAKKHKQAIITQYGKAVPMDLNMIFDQVDKFYSFAKKANLLDYKAVKAMDVKKLVDGHGKAAIDLVMNLVKLTSPYDYKQMEAAINGATVTVVNETKDAATLEVTIDKKKDTVTMALVEGCWVPTEMKTEWPKAIKDGNKNVDQVIKEMKANKTMAMEQLDKIAKSLGELEKDGDFKRFEQSMMQQPAPAPAPKTK